MFARLLGAALATRCETAEGFWPAAARDFPDARAPQPRYAREEGRAPTLVPERTS